jgi:hypothetical protein
MLVCYFHFYQMYDKLIIRVLNIYFLFFQILYYVELNAEFYPQKFDCRIFGELQAVEFLANFKLAELEHEHEHEPGD